MAKVPKKWANIPIFLKTKPFFYICKEIETIITIAI